MVNASRLESLRKTCEDLAEAPPGEAQQKIASLLWQMSLEYYKDARRQAQQSFYCALGAASIGTLFFMYAAALVMHHDTSTASISLIAGALIQVISAINFVLYGRAARQFALFHICLERTTRFCLADTFCENIDSLDKNSVRKELVQVVASAPMLSLDGANGSQPLESTQRKHVEEKSETGQRLPDSRISV